MAPVLLAKPAVRARAPPTERTVFDDWELLALGFLIGFAKSFIPLGPTGLLVVERGLARRYREGLAIGAGGAVVEGAYCLAAVLGARFLMARDPQIFEALRKVGAVVILLVGVVLVWWTPDKEGAALPVGAGGGVLIGVTSGLLNPAQAATWSGVVGVLASQGFRLRRASGLLLPAFLVVGILSSNLILMLLLRRLNRKLDRRATGRILRGIGVALIVLAGWRLIRG
jgi:threonine/homoserine/homoserine lactone efflux protein